MEQPKIQKTTWITLLISLLIPALHASQSEKDKGDATAGNSQGQKPQLVKKE